MKQTNELTKQKQTHRYKVLVTSGERKEGGAVSE